MGKVIYSMNVSLDGYVEDPKGDIGFSAPEPEVHRAANELVRESSALLFGRRMYEIMEEPWTEAAARTDLPAVESEFAQLYLSKPRWVFSDSLDRVPDGCRLVRGADAVAEVTRLKAETDGPLSLGGPALAASLGELVDEYRLYVLPVVVGGGKPFFAGGSTPRLTLLDQATFPGGTVYLRYARTE
jgi:dihydrofolate reductase